jgi:hypothetical protein
VSQRSQREIQVRSGAGGIMWVVVASAGLAAVGWLLALGMSQMFG